MFSPLSFHLRHLVSSKTLYFLHHDLLKFSNNLSFASAILSSASSTVYFASAGSISFTGATPLTLVFVGFFLFKSLFFINPAPLVNEHSEDPLLGGLSGLVMESPATFGVIVLVVVLEAIGAGLDMGAAIFDNSI